MAELKLEVSIWRGRKDGRLKLEPLKNLDIIKVLVVDMSEFFVKLARVKGTIQSATQRPGESTTVVPNSPARLQAATAIDCVGCAVSYSACDLATWNRAYLGLAALKSAWSLINDVRDVGDVERLRAVPGDAGCHGCHTHQSCLAWCPKHLNPMATIAGLNRALHSQTFPFESTALPTLSSAC